MYYFGWILLIVILFLWRRDVQSAKKMHMYIMKLLRNERKEIDSLRDKYIALLNEKMSKKVQS